MIKDVYKMSLEIVTVNLNKYPEVQKDFNKVQKSVNNKNNLRHTKEI